MEWMMENDISGECSTSLCLLLSVISAEPLALLTEAGLERNFSVEMVVMGETKEVELKPGGKDIEVTEENKAEFFKLLARRRLIDDVKPQLSHLLRGFYEVIPPQLIQVFDYRELELFLCGLPSIDVNDWRQNTTYKGQLTAGHKVSKWFWSVRGKAPRVPFHAGAETIDLILQVVEELSQEDKAKLLLYCTGTSRVPVLGFKALESYDGKVRNWTT